MTGARGEAAPRLIGRDGVTRLEPVDLVSERIDEPWIRRLLHEFPDVLPVEQIGLRWGPLASVGFDLAVGGVTISNLFVSPRGELTVAEPTLWRNPPERIDAVERVVALASALGELTFADLESAIRTGEASSGRSLWSMVRAAEPDEAATVDEASFVDAVAANLASGSFLLLIVGDGVRSDFDEIATVIAEHPHLQFHLELVELRPFLWSESTSWVSDDRILVVSNLLARTTEVARPVDQPAMSSPVSEAAPDEHSLDLRSDMSATTSTPPIPTASDQEG